MAERELDMLMKNASKEGGMVMDGTGDRDEDPTFMEYGYQVYLKVLANVEQVMLQVAEDARVSVLEAKFWSWFNALQLISLILANTNFARYLNAQNGAFMAIGENATFLLSAFLMLVACVEFIYVYHYIGLTKSKSAHKHSAIQLFRRTIYVIQNLAIPLTQLFMIELLQPDGNSYAMVIAGVCLFLVMAITFSASILMSDWNLSSIDSGLARAHPRLEIARFFAQISFTMFCMLMPEVNSMIVAAVGASLGVLISCSFVYFQPNYNYSLNVHSGWCYGTVAWFGITSIFEQPIIFALVGEIVVLILLVFCFQYRNKKLKLKPWQFVHSVFEFELKARLVLYKGLGTDGYVGSGRGVRGSYKSGFQDGLSLEDHLLDEDVVEGEEAEVEENMKNNKTLASRASFWSTLEKSKRTFMITAVSSKSKVKVKQEHQKLLKQIDKLYTVFGENSIYLSVFQTYILQSYHSTDAGLVLSWHSFIRATKRPIPSLNVDVLFALRRLEHKYQRLSSSEFAIGFLKSEKWEREARYHDAMACVQSIKFWEMIATKDTNLQQIRFHSRLALDHTIKASRIYGRLIKLQPKSVPILNLFGGFLIQVQNDTANGLSLMSKARQQRRKHPSAVLIMNAEGEINYANNATSVLLENLHLIGKRAKTLLAPPFSQYLDVVIQNYFETGSSHYIGRKFRTFCYLQDNTTNVIEVDVHLSPWISQKTFMFVMMIEPVNENNDSYILVQNDGSIIGSSKSSNSVFWGISEQNRIEAVIPNLPENRSILVHSTRNHGTNSSVYKSLRRQTTSTNQAMFSSGRGIGLVSNDGIKGDIGSDVAMTFDVMGVKNVTVHIDDYDYDGFVLQKVVMQTKDGERVESDQEDDSDLSATEAEGGDEIDIVDLDDSTALNKLNDMNKKYRTKAHRKPPNVNDGASDAESVSGASHLKRMIIQETTHKGLSPWLQKLSWNAVFIVILSISLSLSYHFIESSRLSVYEDLVVFLNSAGLRRFNSVSIAFCVHSLTMLNMGFQLPGDLTETSIRKELRTNIAKLRAIEANAFSKRQLADDAFLEYSQPLTAIRIAEHGGGNHTHVEYHSLFQATNFITALASEMLEMPLEEFNLDDHRVYTLINQVSDEGYLFHLNKTTFQFMSKSESEIWAAAVTFLISMAVALVTQVSIYVIFIRPVVQSVESQQCKILACASSIRANSIDEIRNMFIQRLEKEHAIEYAQPEDEQQQDQVNEKEKHGNKNGEGHEKGKSKPQIRKQSTATKVVPHRRIRESKFVDRKNLFNISMRLLFPIALTSIYFGASLLMGYMNLNFYVATPTSLNFAGLRRATLRFVKHTLFMYLAGSQFGTLFEGPAYQVEVSNVTKVLNMFEHVMQVLYTGNVQGYPGLIKFGNYNLDQITLLMEDGCFQYPGDYNECINFGNGIMKSGLAAGTEQFTKALARALAGTNVTNLGQLDILVKSPSLLEYLDLENLLQVQFTTAVKLYAKELLNVLSFHQTISNVILYTFLTLLVFYHFFVTKNVIRELDQDLRRTRRILLSIPDEVFEFNAKLLDLMGQVLATKPRR